MSLWYIRPTGEKVDVDNLYVTPTLFSLRLLHHGGSFTKFPNRTYINGKVTYVDFVDKDEFSVYELCYMMLELGYSKNELIYYHFKVFDEDLNFGLRALGGDADVLAFISSIGDHKLVDIYTEHHQTAVETYFVSPRKCNVSIKELVDEVDGDQSGKGSGKGNSPVRSTQAILSKTSRRLALEWNVGSSQVATSSVDVGLSQIDVGHSQVEDVGLSQIDFGGLDHSEVQDEGATTESQVVNEEAIHEHGDHEEDIHVEADNEEAIHEEAEHEEGEHEEGDYEESEHGDVDDWEVHDTDEWSDSDDSECVGDEGDDSDDSDYLVDGDNLIEYVEVDMHEFIVNVDHDIAEDIEYSEHSSDDMGLDANIDDFDSLSDENDTPLTKKLRSERRKKNKRKDAVADPFFVRQKFASRAEIKKIIDKLAVESRRQLKVNRNDPRRFRVICIGKKPIIGTQEQSGGKDVNS